MEDVTHNPNLTAPEIPTLWTSYIKDSMAICVIQYFLANVEDRNIHSILNDALQISEQHI